MDMFPCVMGMTTDCGSLLDKKNALVVISWVHKSPLITQESSLHFMGNAFRGEKTQKFSHFWEKLPVRSLIYEYDDKCSQFSRQSFAYSDKCIAIFVHFIVTN